MLVSSRWCGLLRRGVYCVLGPLLRSILEDRTNTGAPLQGAERRELERHLETQFRNLEQLFSQRAHVFGNRPGLADISLYAFLVSLVRILLYLLH